jgi:hypothetical protein
VHCGLCLNACPPWHLYLMQPLAAAAAVAPSCAFVVQEVDVSVNTELRAALKEATGQSTVPQVSLQPACTLQLWFQASLSTSSSGRHHLQSVKQNICW